MAALYSDRGHKQRATVLIAGALLGVSALNVSASYLDELEREAERSFDAPPPPPSRSGTSQATERILNPASNGSERVTPGLDQAAFERTLQHDFYGSYLFYSRLGEAEKQAVYQEYTKNNDIEHLREIIKAKMK